MQNDASVENQGLSSALLSDLVKERRSDRRWQNIRFFLGFLLIIVVLLLIFVQASTPSLSPGEGRDYVSLIRLSGMIGPDEDFSSQTVLPILEDAFSDTDAKGVVLSIN